MDGQDAPTPPQKQYQCPVCLESFKRHEHLIRHSRRHTQEKPFKCDTCHKEFARRDILSRHQIVHVPADVRAQMPQKQVKRGTKRIQQACSNCAKGKCRCDGVHPCSTCQSRGWECEYPIAPTPTKRKRTDSSASTAAAKVLLAVASANVSPKQEYLQDPMAGYSEPVMQPPQVFATQPGVLQPDSANLFFAQHTDGLQPGSVFESRAPSPSHDFDAQFESTAFAPSVFTFLFQDARKPMHLPTLTSILPTLMPTSIFQLGMGFEAGTKTGNGYSSFRDASFPVTRPASPVPSFTSAEVDEAYTIVEDKNHVPRLTAEDKKHLEDYVQLELPSARLLNIFVQLYFEHFHPVMSLLHRPNFGASISPSITTLAVIAIGAQYYLRDTLPTMHRPLMALAYKLVRIEQENFYTMQAQCLLDIADLYSLQSQAVMEAAEERRSSLVKRARLRNMFNENYDERPEDHLNTEGRWQILRRAEERRRLAWGIFANDTMFALLFGVRPLIEVDDIKISLPCLESLWEADTAAEWAAVFEPEHLPLRTRTLWGAGRIEERGAREYGQCCRVVLGLVEARRVFDFAGAVPKKLAPESDMQRQMRQDAESVLANAKMMSHKALTHLGEVLAARPSPSQTTQSDALLNLQFVKLTTLLDMQLLRCYMTGDDRGIKDFYTNERTAMAARETVICAAKLLAILLCSHQFGPFAGTMGLFSVVAMLTFAKYYPANLMGLEPIQLDTVIEGSGPMLRWIETGLCIPIVSSVGVLDAEHAGVVLLKGAEALSHVEWGREQLLKTVEMLGVLM
ncbi:fungal-specific transcription factor domain-domain-containing protein [Protomyces lactucae-debilis]|uniref:Fungal-specific transcription factor domain-domain-containing protein n=1 Tax=Protomyces lactucae-debilis TaxID=2754530 RepID=A0A1Y2FQX0_PROLT|nr:fungal-specific transcription factor domain-containing protein [Protomyces lactucae-debilis]ORY86402.1 fungal-specific transcription factor domain-domain-containing protein [Protomyces lactucae-debilis]